MQRLVEFSGQARQGSFPQDFFPAMRPRRDRPTRTPPQRYEPRIHDNLVEIIGEKEKADSILRCMIEGVVVLDPKGNVLVINEQAKEMFHVPDGRDCTASRS